MYFVYWLISEDGSKTYVGFTSDLQKRIEYHSSKKVKTTKSFGNFSVDILEEVEDIKQARAREKYWKSGAGRKKLKAKFNGPFV